MPPTAGPTKADYQTLRVFPRGGDGDELRVQVVTLEGVSFIDLRMFHRGRPGDEHITVRKAELPWVVDALHRAAPIVGGVPVARKAAPTESEIALRARLSAELRAAIAEARPELEAAVARGDATGAVAILADMAVMVGVSGE